MIKRAVVIFPELEDLELIEEIRRKYDPLSQRVLPHITIMFPFVSDLSSEQLRSHIEKTIDGFKPFSVELQGITGYEGEYLFLNVKRGNDRLIELHDRLYSGVLASYLRLEHTYVPHMTVGRLNSPRAVVDAVESLQHISMLFRTTVSEVTAYRIACEGSRSIELRVQF